MAVYTKLSLDEIKNFINQFDVDEFQNYEEILEGVENSNYLIHTKKNKFVLTIYEKRVEEKDLPFFLNLMFELSKKNFSCPQPLVSKKGEKILKIKGKNAALISFLIGKSKKNLTPNNCFGLGQTIARLHITTDSIKLYRANNLSLEGWNKIFSSIKNTKKFNDEKLIKKIEFELEVIKKNWPLKLPSGIIHADVFPDNVFFENDEITGLIDFYFACTDFYAYEIAICLNSICFDNNSTFNMTKAKNLIEGYETVRKLSNDEKNHLPILARGAAMRFFITRLYDFHNTSSEAKVKIKDPNEYLKRINFHSTVKNFREYFL